ncbi:MAG: hypothetical protein ABSD76_01705 [Terriglobales bacterium]|jgi:hypothetical protein
MEQSSITKDVAILVIGIAFGAIPWLLDKMGIEMPKGVYLGLLILSVLFIGGALINLEWIDKLPWPGNRRMSVGTGIVINLMLLAVLWVSVTGREKLDHPKSSANLEAVYGRQFSNEKVVLDGRNYIDCKFDNVTFRWDGRPWAMMNGAITGKKRLETFDGKIVDTVDVLKALQFLNPDFASDWHHLPPEPH